jgi:hypothetical protein
MLMPAHAAGAAPHRTDTIGDRSHADDHHRPGARLRDGAGDEHGSIIADDSGACRSFGRLGLVLAGPHQLREVRQLDIGLKRLAGKAVAPGIVELHPIRARLDRLCELTRHGQDRGVGAGSAGRTAETLENPGAQPRLHRWCNGRGGAPFAIEGEQAPLVAREDRDQQASDQHRQNHRVLSPTLSAYPISRRSGRCHATPHHPRDIPSATIKPVQHD